jgi:hypothetical protein
LGLKRRDQRKAKTCVELSPPTSCHDFGIVLSMSASGTKRTYWAGSAMSTTESKADMVCLRGAELDL